MASITTRRKRPLTRACIACGRGGAVDDVGSIGKVGSPLRCATRSGVTRARRAAARSWVTAMRSAPWWRRGPRCGSHGPLSGTLQPAASARPSSVDREQALSAGAAGDRHRRRPRAVAERPSSCGCARKMSLSRTGPSSASGPARRPRPVRRRSACASAAALTFSRFPQPAGAFARSGTTSHPPTASRGRGSALPASGTPVGVRTRVSACPDPRGGPLRQQTWTPFVGRRRPSSQLLTRAKGRPRQTED